MSLLSRHIFSFMLLSLSAGALMLPAPVTASTGDFSGWWNDFSSTGSGTVVDTQASASSGGQVSTSGQSVVTGDSSASVKTTTIIRAGDNGGTVDVEVTTKHDGTTNTESVHKKFTNGESVSVEVATSSGSGSAVVNASSTFPVVPKAPVERSWFLRLLERFSSWFWF